MSEYYIMTNWGPMKAVKTNLSKIVYDAPEDMDTFLEVANKYDDLDNKYQNLSQDCSNYEIAYQTFQYSDLKTIKLDASNKIVDNIFTDENNIISIQFNTAEWGNYGQAFKIRNGDVTIKCLVGMIKTIRLEANNDSVTYNGNTQQFTEGSTIVLDNINSNSVTLTFKEGYQCVGISVDYVSSNLLQQLEDKINNSSGGISDDQEQLLAAALTNLNTRSIDNEQVIAAAFKEIILGMINIQNNVDANINTTNTNINTINTNINAINTNINTINNKLSSLLTTTVCDSTNYSDLF